MARSVYISAGGRQWASAQDVRYIERYAPRDSLWRIRAWYHGFPPPLPGVVVHFYSRYALLTGRWPKPLSMYRGAVLTWFHGDPDKEPYRDLACALERYLPRIGCLTTSCQLTASRLLRWGLPSSKLAIVPLGVDLAVFRPPVFEERLAAKKALGIPLDRVCIGSFQKDGVGWGSGFEPKLIKGPDVFVDVIRRVSREVKVFALLSGPARGYVIRGLESLGVPYKHDLVARHQDLLTRYHALDVYLISSRDEGGPLALLEALACGVPVVSTRVGMAQDILVHGATGLLANVEDSRTLAELVLAVATDASLRTRLQSKGSSTASAYGWERVTRTLVSDVYSWFA